MDHVSLIHSSVDGQRICPLFGYYNGIDDIKSSLLFLPSLICNSYNLVAGFPEWVLNLNRRLKELEGMAVREGMACPLPFDPDV